MFTQVNYGKCIQKRSLGFVFSYYHYIDIQLVIYFTKSLLSDLFSI